MINFELLSEEMIQHIFGFLEIKSLITCTNVNSFFRVQVNKHPLPWKNAIAKLDLPAVTKQAILEFKTAQALKSGLSTVLSKLNWIQGLSPEKQAELVALSKLDRICVELIVFKFPQLVQSLPPDPKEFGPNIYKSELPNYALFNHARMNSQIALELIRNPDLLHFFSKAPYLRYICLLAVDQPQLIETILTNPEKYACFIKHDDFLWPLKKHPELGCSLTDPIKEMMGQNYQSLCFFYQRSAPKKRSAEALPHVLSETEPNKKTTLPGPTPEAMLHN